MKPKFGFATLLAALALSLSVGQVAQARPEPSSLPCGNLTQREAARSYRLPSTKYEEGETLTPNERALIESRVTLSDLERDLLGLQAWPLALRLYGAEDTPGLLSQEEFDSIQREVFCGS